MVKKMRGFTLLEILIVVIIVGIMATVAMPQFTKMIERAKEAEAMSNLSAIRAAQKVYALDNNGAYTDDVAELFVELETSSNWTFTTAATGSATATRSGGAAEYNGKTIILSIDGTIDTDNSTWPLL